MKRRYLADARSGQLETDETDDVSHAALILIRVHWLQPMAVGYIGVAATFWSLKMFEPCGNLGGVARLAKSRSYFIESNT